MKIIITFSIGFFLYLYNSLILLEEQLLKNKFRSYIFNIITIRRIINIKRNIVSYYIEDFKYEFFWLFLF